MLAFVVLLVASSDGFTRVGEAQGVLVESRPVAGSAFVELRVTTVVAGDAERLCARAFGTGRVEAGENVDSRQVLAESDDERVTYEQIAPPMVSRRDYALRSRRVRPSPGTCRVEFEAANELAPPPRTGQVRIEQLKGFFAFEQLPDGRVKVTHQIHMDPGGQIAPWMAEATRRDLSVASVRRLVSAK